MKTICLNLIVKDESRVIRACLTSVAPLIHTWVIVDTGSTDGTQEIIRAALHLLPGELHERPWVDFAHNRNEALALARGKADYLLFLDADEELLFEPTAIWPALAHDLYLVVNRRKRGLHHPRALLAKSDKPWRWIGAVHEYLHCDAPYTCAFLPGVTNVSRIEGARSQDPQKYLKDAAILERELEKHPDDERSLFYLGQSYQDAGAYERALPCFQRRAALGGRPEIVFFSLYMIGWLELRLGRQEAVDSLSKAVLHSPHRAEPLFWIANHYFVQGLHRLAALVLGHALSIPLPPPETMRVEAMFYEYGFVWQFAVNAQALGDTAASEAAFTSLLSRPLPEETLACIAQDREIVQQRWPS